MLPENEYTEFEERKYTNPQVSLDEQLGFIDNLRATQQANNAGIRQDTYNLGTAIPSNLGGLVGGEGYFTSRYQVPQTNALVADLRAVAQAKALSDVLANEQAKMNQRYQRARYAYNRRARNAGGGGGTTSPAISTDDGDAPEYVTTTPGGIGTASVSGMSGSYTLVDPAGTLHIVDMNTNDYEAIRPGQKSKTRQQASAAVGGGELRTLPNGNKVLVKPGYGLTKEGGKYYLVNQSNGNRTQVGG